MNLDNRKVLCLTRGGSHAYGLSTPTSDIDLRGVFVNTDVSHLVGLKRDEILVEQNEQHDKVMTEFRHALKLLRQANTQMVELLYTESYEEIDQFWTHVMAYRKDLVSSEKLFNCLRGYMQGELRLANGERTGKLGGKRKEAIDKYKFSPKNFTQYFRLAMAGRIYFQKGYFPVNIFQENPKYSEWLMTIKTQPQTLDVEYLNDEARKSEELLTLDYESRKYNTQFDEGVANDLCLKIYGPLIGELYNR
jgi:hypothetical protein